MPTSGAACLTCSKIPCVCGTEPIPYWPTDLEIPGHEPAPDDGIRDTLIDCMTSCLIHGDVAAEAADMLLSEISGLQITVRD